MAQPFPNLSPSPEAVREFLAARPVILHGEQTLDFLVSSGAKRKKPIHTRDKRVQVGSCSVDVQIERYTDLRGNPIEKPRHLPAHQCVIGYTSLDFHFYQFPDFLHSYLSVDTRSRAARHGLVCRGFYKRRGERAGVIPYLEKSDHGTEVAFMFRNYSENTLVLPDMPVQISVIRRYNDGMQNLVLVLKKDGQDITRERYCQHGHFVAYAVHLAEEICFIRKAEHALDIFGEDNTKYLERTTRTEELARGFRKEFFLGNTDEEVYTGGSPAYMFPAHYNRVADADEFMLPTFHAFLMMRTFRDKTRMPVTGNAGILNPGTSGTVVYECLAKGRRNLERHLAQGEPFAFVIPLPFADGFLDTAYNNGTHGKQKEIRF